MMKSAFISTAAYLLLTITITMTGYAQQVTMGPNHGQLKTVDALRSAEEAPEKGHHESTYHHFAMFMGATANNHTEHTDFTIGLEYEYQFTLLSQRMGIGALGEAITAEHKEYVIGVPVYWHPYDQFKILAAPSVLMIEDHDSHFLFRLGAGYDFHISRYSVTPLLEMDWFDSHSAIVFGVGVGVSLFDTGSH